MTGLELKEAKKALVKGWEEKAHTKLEEELTEEGLNVFWSESTTLAEARMMIQAATINAMFGAVSDVVFGFLFDEDEEPEDEPCNVKNGTPYRIVRKKDNHLFEMEFETEKAARDFIEDAVRHSPYTINDFSILKVL